MLGEQGEVRRPSPEARGEVYKGRGERATVQAWTEMVGAREAGWLHVGFPWREQDPGTCAQVCDGVPKMLTQGCLEVVESLLPRGL